MSLKHLGLVGLAGPVLALTIYGQIMERFVGVPSKPSTSVERQEESDLVRQYQARMRPGAKLSGVQIRNLRELEQRRTEARATATGASTVTEYSRSTGTRRGSSVFDQLQQIVGTGPVPVTAEDWAAEGSRRESIDPSDHAGTWTALESLGDSLGSLSALPR